LEWIALALGAYKIVSWIIDFSLSTLFSTVEDDPEWWLQTAQGVSWVDRALDFVALPLFVYGFVALLVAQRRVIAALLASVAHVVGGKLRSLALKHMSLKPHRIAGFLLIVGLMASVSLYPSIASKSFEDKALRGATVQVGSDLHISISPTDFVAPEELEQALGGQVQAIRSALKEKLAAVTRPDIVSLDYVFEAILPGFFFPGYGLSGVPLYLLDDPDRYLRTAIFEEKLGVTGNFTQVVATAKRNKVLASPPVAAFWNLAADEPVLLGADLAKKPVLVPAGGIVGFLPGMPPRGISDRQSYVSARIDYLNHLASTDAYLAGTMDNPATANLKVLIPRILLLVRTTPQSNPELIAQDLSRTLKARPLKCASSNASSRRLAASCSFFSRWRICASISSAACCWR
jgi:hypothetical protein